MDLSTCDLTSLCDLALLDCKLPVVQSFQSVMAESEEREYKFRQVTIIKEECLGKGAYGVVYKAKCDELICAAKYLHPIFFDHGNAGSNDIVRRFKKECQLLGHLKHPNIVQYLGTHEEEGTNTVILLMELLDCSLHSYLDQHSGDPLPFHQEINIIHDVSRALDYLHINHIYHRDLSCKNILMLGELRAKVSDFGVSKLRDPNSGYSNDTPCPGNILYMPPEALKIPPNLTDTLDEFSLGVVIIQILNRKYPEPTALHRDSTTSSETLTIIPEIERRKNDLDLCDPTNPLLQLAITCISNNPLERHTAEKMCKLLSVLKQTAPYKESVKGTKKQGNENKDIPSDFIFVEMDDRNDYYTSKMTALQNRLDEQDQLIADKENLLRLRNQQLLQKQKIIEDIRKEMMTKEAEMLNKEEQLQVNVEQLTNKDVEIVDRDQQLIEMRELLSQKEVTIFSMEQQLHEKDEQLRRKDEALRASRDDQVSSDKRFSTNLTEIELLRQELLTKNQELDKLRGLREFNGPTDAIKQPVSPNGRGFLRSDPLPRKHSAPSLKPCQAKLLDLRWRVGKNTPLSFQPQSNVAVMCNAKVYVAHCNYNRSQGKIYEYDILSDMWTLLPVVQKSEFSLAVVDNYIVAVGGSSGLKKTGTILQLLNSKWIKAFPDVPTPRSFPICVSTDNYLVVAGGEISSEPVSYVEILNFLSSMWLYAPGLPSPINQLTKMTASVVGEFAYFLGGFDEGTLTNKAYTVNVKSLVQEISNREGRKLWLDLPQLPVSGATCISLQNRILAIGGYNARTRSCSDVIYEFDQIKGSWENIGRLPYPVSRCLAVVASVNQQTVLVVIGGNTANGVSNKTSLTNI